MKRRASNGWWNTRSQDRQRLWDVLPDAPLAIPRAPKLAYAPKGPAPVSDVAKDVLRLIRDRVVRASGLAAYYWSDKFMQAIAWLDRGVLRFLKARHMIHKTAHGVYRLTELAMKLLAPIPAPAKRILVIEKHLGHDVPARQTAAALLRPAVERLPGAAGA